MSNYSKLVSKDVLHRVRRANKETPALIEYDSLPIKYRRAWESLHGDPRAIRRFAPLIDRVKPDYKAREVYATYRYRCNTTNLKPEIQKSYSHTVEIFNAVTETLNEMQNERGSCRLSMRGAWRDYIIPAIETSRKVFTPNDLPNNPITIERKYKKYISEGYYSLIHSNYDNNNASLVKDSDAQSMMIAIMSNGRQYASRTGVSRYNTWARETGRPEMTSRTFLDYIKRNSYLIKAQREGQASWNNRYDENIHRFRPSAPLLLVNSDDNNLDFFFKSVKDKVSRGGVKTVTTDYYRYKMYLVLDPHCDYILGYSLGDQITTDLVVEAYRNAINHVKELTGGYYLWHEIVADNWNRTTMKEFFERQAKTTLTQVGNAKAKYIERFFGIEWHEDMKLYNNHSGYNITAKTKPNPDWIKANRANFPTKAEGVAQIAHFVEGLRNKLWKETGKTRKQVWLENFFKSEKSSQNAISDQTFLDIFGVQRYKRNRSEMEINRITNDGLTISISQQKYNYQIPSDLYRATLGKDAYTIIDPSNLSRILVRTVDMQHCFVASQRRIMPSCLADMVAGDMEYWHSQMFIKDERRKAVKKELQTHLDRAEQLDVESYLQSGDLTKGINQAMSDAYLSQIITGESIHDIITH